MNNSQHKVDVPCGASGNWAVSNFEVTEQSAKLMRLRANMNGSGRYVPAGTYTRLVRNSFTVMSDTPDEINDHLDFIRKASGHVLIAGLGLGMVVQAVAQKPNVLSVTVIEQSADVLTLVQAHYLAKPYAAKLTIVESDIFAWKPPAGVIYDWGWFDIWNDLSVDNLTEMTQLARRFSRRVKNKGFWGKEVILKQEQKWKKINKVFNAY